jgi:glycosyltransferase involved in cell wall biosynthesis
VRIFVVIPAYNEGGAIGQTLADVKKYYRDIAVVDDGSTDETARVAEEAGAVVLRHIVNRGQGAALRTGIRYALENGADIIVTYDADGQFEPSEIAKVAAPILAGERDVVLGSRFLQENKIPILRRVTLGVAGVFTRVISGLKLTDTHNGFRAFSRRAAEAMQIRQDRMAHASEILQEIGRMKLNYCEVPVTVKYTDYSRAKGQKLSGVIKIIFDLIFK